MTNEVGSATVRKRRRAAHCPGHLRDAGFRIAFQLSDEIGPAAPMLTVRPVLVGPDVSGRELLTMTGVTSEIRAS
jgi:hypothetical protein